MQLFFLYFGNLDFRCEKPERQGILAKGNVLTKGCKINVWMFTVSGKKMEKWGMVDIYARPPPG